MLMGITVDCASRMGNGVGHDFGVAAPRAGGIDANSSPPGCIGAGKDSNNVDTNSRSGGAAGCHRNAGSLHVVLLYSSSIPFARFKMTATIWS